MTLTEKILAAHAGKADVSPGDIISISLDLVMANELSAAVAITEFRKIQGATKVWDASKIALVPSHFTPNKDIATATLSSLMRSFAKEQQIENYFEVGRGGIEHVVLPENGMIGPGMTIIGGDSHTTTYGGLGAFATGVGSTDIAAAFATGEMWVRVPPSIKIVYEGTLRPYTSAKDIILQTIGRIGVDGAIYAALEFTGPTVKELPISGRFTMANMSIEAGAKNGIFAVDASAEAYCAAVGKKDYTVYHADKNAEYQDVIAIDCSGIEPQVAIPWLPENTKNASDLNHLTVAQAVIGTCTNGRIEDMRQAAEVLKGRKIHPDVRAIVIPGSQKVYMQCIKEGLAEIFVEAGCVLSTPTCGPCVGGHMGVLSEGERCISTTNRNFRGRMGHVKSEVYLAGPYVAAASAIAGFITGPEQLGAAAPVRAEVTA
ncbi:MAG: 3-isopropylmalate dehydratase large subunit [Candidatus Eremiobacter antarcticus]|nr:3-isopropylmalate dehydratase large subunit [Candidatus Eremiobacteraeota bacterium]MBC5808943.1 3-isopropylmalate dehydratase large subunit [Candidatus Eremiobacteraeota bacterium]PZR60377.1 MAG: 3-isopropylmalate dehydratase large subunit [Candidatus Eremiobacter sp. RRmetagenome_bin22]